MPVPIVLNLMPFPIVNGAYGGYLMAVVSSFLSVGAGATAQNLIREDGLSPVQVTLMRMTIATIIVAALAAYFQPGVFRQMDIRSASPRSAMDAEQSAGPHQLAQGDDSDSTPLLAPNGPSGNLNNKGNEKDAPRARLLALWSVILGISIISAYEAMGLVDLSDLIAIYNTVFFPVAIMGWLVLRERFTVKMAFAACISTGAVICIAQPALLFHTSPDHSGDHRYVGYVLAAFTVFLQALDVVIMRKISKGPYVMTPLFAGSAATSLLSVVYILLKRGQLVGLARPLVWMKAFIHSIVSLFTHGCFVMAIQRATAARVAMICYTQIPFALLYQITFLGTMPSGLKVCAMMVIIGAGIWVILSEKPADCEVAPEDGDGRV